MLHPFGPPKFAWRPLSFKRRLAPPAADRQPGRLRPWRQAARPRLRAAGLHAIASLALAAVLTGVLVHALYPTPFFHAAGGASLLALMVLIDVVIGPCLTFVVFDARKPRAELRRDLAVIVALQAAALGYGLYSTALGRPVFMTFVVDRFELVSAAEVDADELARAPQALRALSWSGPRLAGAVRPTDPRAREQLLLAGLAGIDLKHLISRYVPYESMQAEVAARLRPLAQLEALNDAASVAAAVRQAREAGGEAAAGIGWLPVSGRAEDLVALVDARSGRVLKVVRLKPW